MDRGIKMTNIESLIRNYVVGKSSNAQIESIDNLKKKDSVAELLFELVDACLKITKPKVRYFQNYKELNQDEIEILIMRLLTFNIRKKDASIFLQQLFHNPRFYDQLEPSLSIATTPYSYQMKSPTGIKVHKDAHIFKYLVEHEKSAKKYHRKAVRSFWFQRLDLFKYGINTANGPAIAFVSIIVIAFAAYSYWDNPARTEIYKSYLAGESAYISQNFSNGAPEIAYTILRGSTGSQESTAANSALNNLSSEIDIARDYYEFKQFKTAHTLFKEMSSRVSAISEQPEALPTIKQYHFYFGMTHLGIAGKKIVPKSHLLEAIVHLKKADELAPKDPGVLKDEIRFFLGFAYTLIDDNYTADIYLCKIKKDSPFYNKANELQKNY
jgi:hypothetical protein